MRLTTKLALLEELIVPSNSARLCSVVMFINLAVIDLFPELRVELGCYPATVLVTPLKAPSVKRET